MSVQECKTKCNGEASCLAFEYGVPYGGKYTIFKPKDCSLQNGVDPKGCDGAHYNLDLYVKKGDQSILRLNNKINHIRNMLEILWNQILFS